MDDQIFLAVWIGSVSLILLCIGVLADGLQSFIDDEDQSLDGDQ